MAKTSTARMALWVILIAVAPFLTSAADVNYGLQMFAKGGRGACWVERLHKLPTKKITNPMELWGNCEMLLKFKDNEWADMYKFYADQAALKGASEEKITGYAIGNQKTNMKNKFDRLPSEYRASCEKFMDNENQAPAKDFSSLLKDSSEAYPFKGLAHCMLEVAERRNGKEEMAALKSRWATPKPFQQAILDRENENRARHAGTPPLTLDSELSTRAQRWADKLAAANFCRSEHLKDLEPNNPDIQYQGDSTGENISENGYTDGEDGDTGMSAANSWYTEIQDYPWPAYNGMNKRGVIGHFTQSVWKSSRLAGYGIGRSPGCNKVFVVARYFPAGNLQWGGVPDPYKEYPVNVLPPQY